MAKFITGSELNFELEKIFEDSKEQLILVSPYIKLHHRLISILHEKKENHKLQIYIVFGKNEADISKSMNLEDFNFLKEFPNIQIRYEKRLHAKYYANDNDALLTSMNLYSYSQNNNIEAGVLIKSHIIGNIFSGDKNLDMQAYEYFDKVIYASELLFHKVPIYETGMLGLTKKYTESRVEVDKLTDFFYSRIKQEIKNGKQIPIEKENPSSEQLKYTQNGYCIRTGKPIPFNPNRPFSELAYQSWAKFANEKYPEKYCHFSGEPSNGETSKLNPILRKNWIYAKRIFNP